VLQTSDDDIIESDDVEEHESPKESENVQVEDPKLDHDEIAVAINDENKMMAHPSQVIDYMK